MAQVERHQPDQLVVWELGHRNLRAALEQLTGERLFGFDERVDLVFDHVIASDFADLFKMLADFGTLVFYNVHTPMPKEDVYARMRDLSTRSPALRCFNIHTYDRHPEQRRSLMKQVIELFARGRINPRVGARLPMSAAAEAHKLLEAGAVIGKIVLHP